jgi:hypothetical protein
LLTHDTSKATREMLAKAERQLSVPAFSLYAPRRRLFWQNEKGESVRSLSHPS